MPTPQCWRACPRRPVDKRALANALPLAVFAVEHRVAQTGHVPSHTRREVEEAGVEAYASRDIGARCLTPAGRTREEQARRHVTDRQRASEVLGLLCAVRGAGECASNAIELTVHRVGETGSDADAVELTGVAAFHVPVVVFAERSAHREAGNRRRAVLDVLVAGIQPVIARGPWKNVFQTALVLLE